MDHARHKKFGKSRSHQKSSAAPVDRARLEGVQPKVALDYTPAQDAPANAMKSIEVNEKKWSQFCQSMEEYCRGAMISIELNERSDSKNIVENAPLRHVAFDEHADACNSNLVIEVGPPDSKPLRHVVIEPIHIRLHSSNGAGRYNRVQILAENGTTTIILNPGLNEALLKGMEL